MDLYLGGGGQEDVLRRFLICSQRVSLTSVDEVKGHGLLLLDERFLLSMRLEETNTAVNRGDGEHTWSCRASRHWPPKWQACQTDVNLIFLCFYPKSHLGNLFNQHFASLPYMRRMNKSNNLYHDSVSADLRRLSCSSLVLKTTHLKIREFIFYQMSSVLIRKQLI